MLSVLRPPCAGEGKRRLLGLHLLACLLLHNLLVLEVELARHLLYDLLLILLLRVLRCLLLLVNCEHVVLVHPPPGELIPVGMNWERLRHTGLHLCPALVRLRHLHHVLVSWLTHNLRYKPCAIPWARPVLGNTHVDRREQVLGAAAAAQGLVEVLAHTLIQTLP